MKTASHDSPSLPCKARLRAVADGDRRAKSPRRELMAEPAPFHDRDGLIWLDGKLVPWRAGQHPRAHARPALRQRRLRGRARVRRRDLQAQRSIRSVCSTARAPSTSRSPIRSPRSTRSAATWSSRQQPVGLLHPPHRVARQRADRRFRAGDQDPHGGRRLAVGLLLPDRAAPQGYPPDDGQVPPPRPDDGAGARARPRAST